jgi:uncharacterized membrane protein (TIGR02234 family)
MTDRSSSSTRRSYAICLLTGAIGGGMVAVSAAKPWATVTVGGGRLPALPVSVDGADVVPVVGALGLVLLAGAVSLAATRNQGRRLAGLVLVGAAVVVGWLTLTSGPAITEALRDQTVGAVGNASVSSDPDGTFWRWLTLAGAGLSLMAGMAAVAKGPDWPTMGSRYERPTSAVNPGDADGSTESDLWRAMDKGEDPTV